MLTIRPYERRDREAVHRLAADTAFFGEPVERYLDDRQLFCDALYTYYTDHEPQHGWVACADEEVIGFLMGCVDTSLQRRLWISRIFPQMVFGVLKGEYRTGPLTWRHVRRLARVTPRTRPNVDLAKYPRPPASQRSRSLAPSRARPTSARRVPESTALAGHAGRSLEHDEPEQRSRPPVRKRGLPPAGHPCRATMGGSRPWRDTQRLLRARSAGPTLRSASPCRKPLKIDAAAREAPKTRPTTAE